MKKILKSLFISLCSPIFEKMGFVLISQEEHYHLLDSHQVSVRVTEAQRWFNEFRADLMPLWMFLWGKNGIDPSAARDHFKKMQSGEIPTLKKALRFYANYQNFAIAVRDEENPDHIELNRVTEDSEIQEIYNFHSHGDFGITAREALDEWEKIPV